MHHGQRLAGGTAKRGEAKMRVREQSSAGTAGIEIEERLSLDTIGNRGTVYTTICIWKKPSSAEMVSQWHVVVDGPHDLFRARYHVFRNFKRSRPRR
jgi:hypothetical protein